jgi:hypothetical protein
MRIDGPKPPLTAADHGRRGGWEPSIFRCLHARLESINETPLARAELLLTPTAIEHRRSRGVHVAEVEEPDAARQIHIAAKAATVKPSTGRSAAA